MANETVIEKKPNGVILVTTDGTEYTLKSNYRLQKNAADVEIRDDSGGSVAKFTASEVEKVILIDASEVVIGDLDTLFTQLHTNFFFRLTGGGTGIGETAITDTGIIATITDDANWDIDGNYIGSTAGLVSGNIHYDDNFNLKYHFDGTTLRRFTYNEVI